jgi:hypothetical protein
MHCIEHSKICRIKKQSRGFKKHLNIIVSKTELCQFNTRTEGSVNTLKLTMRKGKLEPEEVL